MSVIARTPVGGEVIYTLAAVDGTVRCELTGTVPHNHNFSITEHEYILNGLRYNVFSLYPSPQNYRAPFGFPVRIQIQCRKADVSEASQFLKTLYAEELDKAIAGVQSTLAEYTVLRDKLRNP